MSTNQSNAKYLNIRDIAKLAGVSTATVSRVLNHPELTSPEIRARVQAIVQEHHYVPNQMVKSLFSHSADSIAVFVYDMANPFFIALIQELNRVAFDHKHALLICDTSNDIQKESDYLDYCAAIRVKGIILTEGFEFNPASNQLHSPLVMFDRVGQNVWPSVQSDNTAAIARAVKYLHNLNHRRIACIAPDTGLASIQCRCEGYRSAMEESGLFRPEYLYDRPAPLSAATGIDALNYFFSLPEPPTAILCSNDLIAQGVHFRAAQMNISVPRNLSIIGFDGIPLGSAAIPLTTIKQDIPAIAKTLFELCLHPPKEPRVTILPTEFIPGQTCGWCSR